MTSLSRVPPLCAEALSVCVSLKSVSVSVGMLCVCVYVELCCFCVRVCAIREMFMAFVRDAGPLCAGMMRFLRHSRSVSMDDDGGVCVCQCVCGMYAFSTRFSGFMAKTAAHIAPGALESGT